VERRRTIKGVLMASSIQEALEKIGPRPPDTADRKAKQRYAELLSRELAILLARHLRRKFPKRFPGLMPGDGGEGQESLAGAASGAKRLDVNYSTARHGLGLGVSIKTISHRDKAGKGRYTKNRKRVDEEFLAEAMDYHVRQPYAVLVGLYFLPADACGDAKGAWPSSFGAWVEKLYARAGRDDPKDNAELFERMYVGLFDPTDGAVSFFDVTEPPPKKGPPPKSKLLSWDRLLDDVESAYVERNTPFRWASGEEELPGEAVGDFEDEEEE
jgi:hypothetical protein